LLIVWHQPFEIIMRIEHLDHFVLTLRNIDVTIRFYQTVLGMTPVTFDGGRKALTFGNSKINLHSEDAPIAPHAKHPVSRLGGPVFHDL
jgi:catechol 2,3-dioxygenase-like lactoylglutathione lyase family enzyme